MSGVVSGVGYPEERLSFSECWGLDGVEVLSLLVARFLIMDRRESALEILLSFGLDWGGGLVKDRAERGLRVMLLVDSMDSMLDSNTSSLPLVPL